MIDSSHTAGVKAVEAVLALRSLLKNLDATIGTLEARVIRTSRRQDESMDDDVIQLQRAQEKRASIAISLRRKSSALGITQRTNLARVVTDDFASLRMNAYLLKQRIRDRLRERKFELHHREQSYRDAVNGNTTYILIPSC